VLHTIEALLLLLLEQLHLMDLVQPVVHALTIIFLQLPLLLKDFGGILVYLGLHCVGLFPLVLFLLLDLTFLEGHILNEFFLISIKLFKGTPLAVLPFLNVCFRPECAVLHLIILFQITHDLLPHLFFLCFLLDA
jgi:hypothetical protein